MLSFKCYIYYTTSNTTYQYYYYTIIFQTSKHWLGRSELVDIPSKQEFNNSKYSKTTELCTKVKKITLNNFFGVFNINFEHVMFQLLF